MPPISLKTKKREKPDKYMREAYLDNSATTRCFPEVADLMHRISLEEYGNPSSMHHKGVEAEEIVRGARKTLAEILKVPEKTLFFTSCGTESDNLSIIGGALAAQRRGRHLVTTRIEHPAVLESMRYLESEGFSVTYLPVDRHGIVSPQAVEDAVRDDTILVSVMHTNNEIGSVQPVAEIGECIKRKNPSVIFHVDAVQGFGKAWIRPAKMHIDLLSVSGHKIHGPKGMGLLYKSDRVRLRNLIYGGGQQGGLRSGTENVPGIAGMALAARMLYSGLEEERERLFALRKSVIDKVQSEIPGIIVNGAGGDFSRDACAPHILSLTIPGVRAEVLLHALEEKGVYVSSGSACSSNRPHVSDTLTAIGLKREYLDSTIRLSFSVMNTQEDADQAAAALRDTVPFLRQFTRH